MSVAQALAKVKTNNMRRPRAKSKYPSTLGEYLNWQPKDGYKYEWVEGELLIFPSMVTEEQFHIVDNLQRYFAKTKAYAAGDSLMPETRNRTKDLRYRIPDIGYYSLSQKRDMYEGKQVTTCFAIEIISPTNSADEMFDKLIEYFDAGVLSVWYIYPKKEMVCVYHSLEQISICKGNDLCHAEKAIEGFSIAAKDIFKKP